MNIILHHGFANPAVALTPKTPGLPVLIQPFKQAPLLPKLVQQSA